MTRYRDRVYAFALACTGSSEEACDVVCETFATAFQATRHGATGSPRRWFHVHALRAVIARRARGRVSIAKQRIEP